MLGYKLHLRSSNDSSSVIVPLSADITTANVYDKPVYPDLISYLSSEKPKKIRYMVADPGHNDQKLYDLSLKKGFQLVCSVRKYKSTSKKNCIWLTFINQHWVR